MASVADCRSCGCVFLVAVGPGHPRAEIGIVRLPGRAGGEGGRCIAAVASFAVKGGGSLPVVAGHALGGSLAVAVAVGRGADPAGRAVGAALAGLHP